MINEGGKWAHVVLRKCVFEPKAAGISSLMHQPSTGHLRSSAALLARSRRRDVALILLKLIHSLSSCFCFSFPFPPFGTFMSFHAFLEFLSHLLCFNLITSFLPLCSFRSFFFLLSLIRHSPLSSPPFSTTLTASLGFAHTAQKHQCFSVSVFRFCVI